MKDRYVKCTNCGQIHQTHHSFKDKRPTCYKCGRSSFEEITVTRKETVGHIPIMCDWSLQHNIDEAADELLDIIVDKHNTLNVDNTITLPPELKDSLKQYFVFAANATRKSFVNSVENFKWYVND